MNDREIEKKPNKETLEAFKELDNGGGTRFEGKTTEYWLTYFGQRNKKHVCSTERTCFFNKAFPEGQTVRGTV
ncbi:MAG: hypothetical protein KH138_04220 [Firmicutes bacterium]|nr:hypothetical protein [Bacillota bacterium]